MNGARLRHRLPDGTEREIVLGTRTTIGRQPGNELLLHDREVSKSHAVIERVGADWLFRDLGSSNGSFVNGLRTGTRVLDNGDRIIRGASELVFEIPSLRAPGFSSRVTDRKST